MSLVLKSFMNKRLTTKSTSALCVCSDSTNAVDSTATASRRLRVRRRRLATTADCSTTTADRRVVPDVLGVVQRPSGRADTATAPGRHRRHRRAVVGRSRLLRYDVIHRRADRQVYCVASRRPAPACDVAVASLPCRYCCCVTTWD